MIVFLDLGGGIARNCDKLSGLLGGAVVGLAEGFDEKFEEEADKSIKRGEAKAGIFYVAIVKLPIILRGRMAITEVGLIGGEFDGFSLSTGDGNDEVVIREVKVTKIDLAERAKKFAESGGKNLQPTGFNGGVIKPVDTLFAIL